MLKRILLMCKHLAARTAKFDACQKWEPAGRIGDFGNFLNGFAKSPRVLRTVLNIEWVQFVLKNCEILHFVWGLYDKNSAS